MSKQLEIGIFSLIENNTLSSDKWILEKFIQTLKRMYQYEILKPFLDFAVTMIHEKRLKFKVSHKQFYNLENGSCVTISGGEFDKVLGLFRRSNQYTINIMKISPDVIIHEIGHMIESELNLKLNGKFSSSILLDLKNLNVRNLSLKSAINNVMIEEVKAYPEQQRLSEMFTRYFQLIAMAKEISGLATEYGYTIPEFQTSMKTVESWLWDEVYKLMLPRVSSLIANQSKSLIVPIEDIKHKWSEEKVEPIKGSKPWSKTVKSIKD